MILIRIPSGIFGRTFENVNSFFFSPGEPVQPSPLCTGPWAVGNRLTAKPLPEVTQLVKVEMPTPLSCSHLAESVS